jgi:transcription initiation factor TFIIH subunit 2
MLLGAIASQDPSHPASCLSIAISTRTSISTIHLAAEMFICKRLSNETGGTLTVPLSENHLVHCLESYASSGPLPLEGAANTQHIQSQARLLIMGFPTMDALSKENDSALIDVVPRFTCPRCLHCLATDTSLPTNCPICKLMLVKSQQLARSYSHLFPQPDLKPLTLESEFSCYGCTCAIPAASEIIPLPEAQPIMSFNTSVFQTPSAPSAPSSSSNIPITSQCYQCQECQSIYCGLCKEGTLMHLHQCLGCLEKV